MNEQEQSSQLSALFDGELPAQQAEMVTRRVLRDPALRASWERYALIGACLRGEPIVAGTSVADRVRATLAAERDLNVTTLPVRDNSAAGRELPRSALYGRGLLGGAIAAGVAVLSIFVVRQLAPDVGGEGALLAQGATPVSAASQPVGYTTPGENAPAQSRMVDAALSHIMVAHSEEAASALRYSYDGVPVGAKLTEDLISALR